MEAESNIHQPYIIDKDTGFQPAPIKAVMGGENAIRQFYQAKGMSPEEIETAVARLKSGGVVRRTTERHHLIRGDQVVTLTSTRLDDSR